MRYQTYFSTISSGATVSGIVEIKGAKSAGIVASFPNSTEAFLQVSADGVAFARSYKPDGSGQWLWAIGSGSGAVSLQDSIIEFPFLQIETGTPMSDIASLTVVVKL